MVNPLKILAAIVASVVLGSPVLAGTFFRLEIGHPIAAGTGFKVKNAVLVVRPLACDDAARVRITGTAEGVVNGVRQSVALKLTALPTPGVHAVPRQWPDGQWVLHLTGTCPGLNATASTLVPLNGKSRFIREKAHVLRAPATPAQIEASLAELVRAGES